MKKLTKKDYQKAANELQVDVAVIKAVCKVEAPMGGFLSNGTPVILFERHKFHQFTKGIFSQDYPSISNPRPGGYKGKYKEHDRLQSAVNLDRESALLSASWGKFQIMGFNYKLCGFEDLQDFINAMFKSEEEQLYAFVNFIKSVKLQDELQRKDWKAFAKAYNGKAYRKNKYAKRMQEAYNYYQTKNKV